MSKKIEPGTVVRVRANNLTSWEYEIGVVVHTGYGDSLYDHRVFFNSVWDNVGFNYDELEVVE